MADALKNHPPRKPGAAGRLLPIFTLANWQMHQTWRLLALTAVGMIAAVVLVCSVPLYSRVALSAGLRSLIKSNDSNSTLLIYGTQTQAGLSGAISQTTDTVENDMFDSVNANPALIMHVDGPSQTGPSLGLFLDKPDWKSLSDLPAPSAVDPQIQLQGFDEPIASHVKLNAGRLPQTQTKTPNVVEIALLNSAATTCLFASTSPQGQQQQCITAKVGDEFTVVSPFYESIPPPASDNSAQAASTEPQSKLLTLTLRVVGLFTPKSAKDPFWHNRTFTSDLITPKQTYPSLASALVANQELTTLLDQPPTVPGVNASSGFGAPTGPTINLEPGTNDIYWYFSFDLGAIQVDGLNDLINNIQTTESDVMQNNQSVIIQQVVDPLDTLQQYAARLQLAEIPVDLLLIIVTGMVMLFVTVTTELLVERQADVIAILRSRGASRRQIFGIFTAQSLGIAVLVLVIGPFLAIPVAVALIKLVFSASDMGALALITTDPLSTAWSVSTYAIIALVATLLVALFTLLRATSMDVLALRRETGRTTRPSIWERFYLDGLLAALALGGYGYTLYALHTNVLDPQTSIELLSPLVLLSSMVFLLAVVLLFLRFFPRFAQWAAHQAARQSGAAPMLALAQIARSPRQGQRVILLLTLTTALAIFALIFSASQSQRITDVVNFQVGSDFSAWINQDPDATGTQTEVNLAAQTALYRSIPGVASASVGTISTVHIQNTALIIKAVDPTTFGKTAIWTSQDSSQPLSQLLSELVKQRRLVQSKHLIPAIVDAETWRTLNLSPGAIFSLQWNDNTRIDCEAIEEVQHIPTTNTTVSASLFTSSSIMVDYQSLSSVYTASSSQPLTANYLWLRTQPGTSALAVRTALQHRLQGGTILFDRQAFINSLQQDPVSLNLAGALTVGTITPLLLALLGSFLVSWLSARNRLLNFSILRALGTSPRQIANVLSWEQSFIYILMLMLGIVAGIVLSAMVLPSLVLSSIVIVGSDGTTSNNPALLGSLPGLRMVIPPSLLLVIALLIVICATVLLMMVRMVSRPSLSQILRLNSD